MKVVKSNSRRLKLALFVVVSIAIGGLLTCLWPTGSTALSDVTAKQVVPRTEVDARQTRGLVKDIGSRVKAEAREVRQKTSVQVAGESKVTSEAKSAVCSAASGGNGGNVPPASPSVPASGASGNWPQPNKIVPNGRIVAYRSCELPPRVKGEAPGELHEWLMTPDEGYTSHAEEEYRPNDDGELELVATRHYVANQVMMTLDAETSLEAFRQKMAQYGAIVKDPLMETEKGGKIVAVMVPDATFEAVSDLKDAVLECDPRLKPENDNINTVSRVPNDTRWSNLWGMSKISATSAWDSRTDSSSILVAVLDTGIRYTHEDLSGSMWQNPSPGSYSGVSGDTYGMRCIGGVKSGNPMDDNSHGSHCAGTIGGVGNNSRGVAGVAWKAKMMALKFLNASGSGSDSDAIVCMDYARAKGVKVISCSFGGRTYNGSVYSAISTLRSNGIIVVAAAGNDGTNNDSQPHYPSSYSLDNIIAVAATTSSDTLASFSCYGATSVDIAAPGQGIWSSTADSNSSYESYNGTSMATPHVAGAVALVWAHNPSLSYSQVIARILDNGDSVSALSGKVKTGKRLNVYRSMGTGSSPSPSPNPPSATQLDAPVATATRGTYSDRVVVSWPAVSGATHYKVYWSSSSTGEKHEFASGWQTARSYTDTVVFANTTYYYFVRAAASASGDRASNYSAGAPGWPSAGGDQWDPTDDQPSSGTLLTPTTSVLTHGQHTLDATDRYDFYRIQMTAGRTYYFETTGSFDMYGELFSSTSTNLSYRVAYDDDGGDSFNFKLEYKPTVSQTYYLRVRRYAVGLETTYSLRYWYEQSGDAWDPDETTGNANYISPATSLSTHGPHTLDASDTSDCFRMTLTAGRTYLFYSRGSFDTYGELFRDSLADGNRVAYNDDGQDSSTGSSLNFRISYTPTVSGTYYLKVRAYNTSLSISYTLAYQTSGSSSLPDIVYTPVSDFYEDGGYSWTVNGFMTTSSSGRTPMTTFTTGDTIRYRWAVSDSAYAAITRPFTNYIRVVNSANAQVADGNIVVNSVSQNGLVINTSTLPSLPSGSYTLTSRLNQDRNGNHTLAESNYGNNTKTVTFTVRDPEKVLSSISISGNATVPSEGSATYRCTATYTDGTTSSVSPSWSLSSTTYATISAGGVLTARAPTTARSVTITASYSGRTATKTVTIAAAQSAPKADPFDNPVAYPTSPMIIEAVARIDGALAEAGDVVAATVDSEVRGVGTVSASGRVSLSVSLGSAGERISFKIWDASEGDNGSVYNGSQALVGTPGSTQGSAANPFVLTFGSSDPFGDPVVSPSAPSIIETKVLIDDLAANSGDILAAFDGETLVGKQVLTYSGSMSGGSGNATGSLLMFLPGRRTLTFKVWDASEQAICICATTLTLSPGETRGTLSSPFQIATRSTSGWNTPVTLNLPAAGWHLVSFSVLPELARPATVFDAVRNQIDYVADGAAVWSPSGINQLNTIAMGQAYWVKTKVNGVTWTVEGSGNPETSIHLMPGWNMVGYTLPRSGSISRVLATAIASGKLQYVVSGSSLYSVQSRSGNLSTMIPGVGYWIQANASYDLVFDYDGMSSAMNAMTMATVSPDEYGPFGSGPNCENDPQAPVVLKDVSFSIFGKRPAVGDCVAVYRVGTDERVAVAKFNDETGVVSLPIYKSEGTYQFRIWNAASGLENPQVFIAGSGSNVSLSTAGVEITGRTVAITGTKPTYTVTFDLDGKATRTGGGALVQTVAYGGSPTLPTFTPVAGLTFMHWNDERLSDIRGNITFRAVFSGTMENAYRITFDKTGGTGGDNYVTAAYGVKPHDITVPKKSGYAFGGYWTTANSGGVQYYGADGKATRTWDKRTATTLWARWTSVTFRVTFEKNGGTGGDNYVTATYGVKPHDITVPKKPGYAFGGYWTTTGTGGVQYYGADGKATRVWDKMATATLWARWTAASYRVTFGKNGGTGGDDYVTATYGAKPHDITVPKKPGYVFGGYWTTTGTGGVQYYGADGKATRVWDKMEAATLWAKWTTASYRVTFGKNGGTGGDDYVTATYGVKPHDITVPKKSGYAFGGYWTTTGTGGVQYYGADGKATRVWDKMATATLWAKWTQVVSCKVTFGKNGGTGGDNWVTVNTGAKPHDVSVPKKANSTFGGYWTTVQSGGVQYIDANGKATRVWDKTSGATLWAKWSNRITFGKNGGTGGDDYVTAFQGVKPHDITPPTRAGYVFDGYWTTTGAGGVQYYFADGSAARNWDKTSNVTLWAKWISGTPVKITLGLNGGTGKTTVYAAKGKSMPRIGVPVRAGYTFGGYWTTTGTGGVQYYKADGTSSRNWDKSAATTLWAKWTAATASVRAAAAVALSVPSSAETDLTGLTFESGYYRGVFADDSGTFDLLLEEDGMAFFAARTEDGDWAEEYEAELIGDVLVLTSENDRIVLRKEDGLVVVE